jgi:hypothetical protein
MDRKVYFGNAEKQVWINAPRTGLRSPSNGFVFEQTLLSGRTFIKRSYGAHRRFSPNWLGSMNDAQLENSLSTIKDFSDGIYGKGPFYWVDPFAADQNILPPNWAAPALTELDWPKIWDIDPIEVVDTPSNLLNYPSKSLKFDYDDTDELGSTKKLRLIIPTGYSLFFGWHGEIHSGTGTVRIDRYQRSDGTISPLDTTPISVSSSNRTNAIVNGTAFSMVDIYFYKGADQVADFTISGMIAQILPSTSFPEPGGFISGRGTTGIEFGGPVQIEYYSSKINDGQIGMSTEWVEV